MSMSSINSTHNMKRRSGVLGLDHAEYSHRSKRVLNSVGRHAPVAPQSIIAQQVVMSLPPQSNHPDPSPSDLMAPVGEQFDAMVPKRGEWAVKIDIPQGESHVSAPYGVARISDTQIYTCGNGVDVNAKIIFAGIVTNAQDGMDDNRDNVGALDIGGTVTGINYGPERLCAGDHVYIGLPHLIESSGNGRTIMVPSVCAAGMPATKAHFGTYRMRWNNVSSAVEDIMEYIDGAYDSNRAQAFVEAKNLHSLLAVSRGIREEVPLYQFATIYAHQRRCSDDSLTANESIVAAAAFLKYMRDQDTIYCKTTDGFDSSLGLAKSESRHPIHVDFDTGAGLLVVGHTTKSKTKDRIIKVLAFADRFKLIAIDLMHNFMRQRMMGKVLVNSDPGQQLDVALGYFA